MAPSEHKWNCTLEDGSIIIRQQSPAFAFAQLKIQFHRTIRVPDNGDIENLPPSMGVFPLFKIHDYVNKLPKSIAVKGGVFFPMYQKEATWIKFTASDPFLVKIYAGGVNAISGEHCAEDLTAQVRRLKVQDKGDSIQDYVITPQQLWLDGFATSPGVVKQFVAMPLGTGYSVEAQVAGQEELGGIQLEVTPLDLDKFQEIKLKELGSKGLKKPVSNGFYVKIRTLRGNIIEIPFSPEATVYQLKCAVCKSEGIPTDQQRMIYDGCQLEDVLLLANYGITTGSTIHLVLKLRGGGIAPKAMGLAAGGMIKQSICKDTHNPDLWDRDATMAFRVHLFNSQDFLKFTGRAPPPCPIEASDYAEAGLPFFDMGEETTDISGQFDKVKSVNELDQQKGFTQGPEAKVETSIIELDKHGSFLNYKPKPNSLSTKVVDREGLINSDGPLRDFRCLHDLELELSNLNLDDLEE
ncbi:hypothetical protein PFICI_03091 [Pestalotiopsis fici W106-1]|uniref:Ubiquitin-like domain-containing protein n=1 Tax=Pestalotiopsis fici (strain W106-1 / CGMCC3.15140) TaxID=1229662 RepID=W3XIJ1_PESFW|nr:uncharacterized protein PFICI_03091 [Pestalotiopsis fici W106-1]ETS85066.1 hypothetical protein PFICI_03091 [Pestalotiopsis fici W106-1]